jgi:hypothetical protein
MTKILPTEHVTAMRQALCRTGVFNIVATSTTLVATHKPTGKEVLRALKAHAGNWIVRHHDNLFT